MTNINIYDINLDFPVLKNLYDFDFFRIHKYNARINENDDNRLEAGGLFLESNLKRIDNSDYAVFRLIPETNSRKIIFTWQVPKEKAEDALLESSFEKLLEISAETGKRDINEVIFENIAQGSIQAVKPEFSNETGNDLNGYNLKIRSRPSQTHRFFRTLGELTVLNSFGIINYWVNKDENVEDWEYKPTKEGLKRKIKEGWAFDTNAFRTNTIYHIYAGNIYFQTARSNEYGYAASVAWTFVGSFIWEYIGEFREQVSTNDMIFTTMGGALAGETLRQGSIFVEQNIENIFFRYFFMTLLDPMRIINRAIDRCFYGDIDVAVTFVNPVLSVLDKYNDKNYSANLTINW